MQVDETDVGLIPGLERSRRGGNRNPLQYSRLENPRDRGTWWAAVYGVAQSLTRVKQLSSSSSNVHVSMLFSQFFGAQLSSQSNSHIRT